MKNYFYILLLFFSIGNSYSQTANALPYKSVLLDSIAKSISSKENLTIEWETSFMYGKERENTSHFAKVKGSKFYLAFKEHTMICDGETVYRKDSILKEVYLSSVDTTVDYNPVKVLTFYRSGYEVKRVKKNKATGKIESIKIKNVSGKQNLIKDAFLYFNTDGILSEITYKTGKNQNYVKIKRLDSTIILKDSEFEIPK